MRPFQWYRKTHWNYPQSRDIQIPCSENLKSHLIWWKAPKNVSPPCREHTLLLFTVASVKGWGAHLEDLTVTGKWSVTETSLHVNMLELKAVFKSFSNFHLQQEDSSCFRQCHSSVFSQQTRGDSLLRDVSNGLASCGFLQSQSNFA